MPELHDATRPLTFIFRDDGRVPNNPLPFVLYRGAVSPDGDTAAALEQLFTANGWRDSWRDGIYDYVHYHSMTHEALGVARGQARVEFGGESGKALDVAAGDVVVLPAGTGHRCINASADFLVVGAYPRKGTYNICRPDARNHDAALAAIPDVPLPDSDPLFGRDGPLLDLWGARTGHN